MILARLSGIELDECPPEKIGKNGYQAGDAPLGKIPTLEWQPGQFLFDRRDDYPPRASHPEYSLHIREN